MQRIVFLASLVFFINNCLCQQGFPKQFQTILNITTLSPSVPATEGVQYLLYDYTNLRARIDAKGWRSKHNETYVIQYKPEGAEADSPASQDYAIFNFNPDYPQFTKNDCWYRTNPMIDIGPFPAAWYSNNNNEFHFEVKSWFPLPSNLIKTGEEWIPEVQMNTIRYDSPEICDLKRSGLGKVPCLSYFEAPDRPVKTIQARAAVGSFDSDQYTSTFYLTFINGIPSEAEHLFDLPKQWPSYCGNANAGSTIDPIHGFVVTPEGNDHFTLKLNTPPVRSLGDQVKVDFKLQPSWYYNGTRCVQFNTIIFDQKNWQIPQQVDMSFTDYGCCNYVVTATGGGYEWQYKLSSFVVYACDGEAGYGCKGKEPCGA
ncbi:unnamed protein product [Adineta steineri]|uniref:Uncharacterized protein n=1 Tax=Adineta steineri TaxID=433720 RepID=A0A819MP91_9BILA|nr:unnamed protein product [Adineta steineri]